MRGRLKFDFQATKILFASRDFSLIFLRIFGILVPLHKLKRYWSDMKASGESGEKVIATNRKARHEYAVLDTVEAGIVLKGTEVKSLRQGNVNFGDGYATIKNGEVWLLGLHVSPYEHGSYTNVDPLRERKLLLHKNEIRKLLGRTAEKGLTLIPLQLYFRKSVAKVLIGICRGKKAYDKRHDLAKRDAERDIRRNYAR
jgi:SsrA-binding protein